VLHDNAIRNLPDLLWVITPIHADTAVLNAGHLEYNVREIACAAVLALGAALTAAGVEAALRTAPFRRPPEL
jgi:hypothetical protein